MDIAHDRNSAALFLLFCPKAMIKKRSGQYLNLRILVPLKLMEGAVGILYRTADSRGIGIILVSDFLCCHAIILVLHPFLLYLVPLARVSYGKVLVIAGKDELSAEFTHLHTIY